MMSKEKGVLCAWPAHALASTTSSDFEVPISIRYGDDPLAPLAVADPSKDGNTIAEWLTKDDPVENPIYALYSPATEGFVYSVNNTHDTAWLQAFESRADAQLKAENLDLHRGVTFPWLEVVEMSHDRARQICIDVPITAQMKSRVLGYRVGRLVRTASGLRYVKTHEERVSEDWREKGKER